MNEMTEKKKRKYIFQIKNCGLFNKNFESGHTWCF